MHRYEEVYKQSKEFNEINDCGVKSLALVADIEYHVAHSLLEGLGRKRRRGTNVGLIMQVLTEKLNRKLFSINPNSVKARTLLTITREPKLQEGTFLIITSDHGVAMKDGQVLDWAAGSRKRIRYIIEVV